MSFYLFGKPDEKLRLKAFSGTSRDGKMVLKIELEAADAFTFAYALENLAEVKKGQAVRTSAARSRPQRPPPLALPAPLRTLPKT